MILGVLFAWFTIVCIIFLFLALVRKERNSKLFVSLILTTGVLSSVVIYGIYYGLSEKDIVSLTTKYNEIKNIIDYENIHYYNKKIHFYEEKNILIYDCKNLNNDQRTDSSFVDLYNKVISYNTTLAYEKATRNTNFFIILWDGYKCNIPDNLKEIKFHF